LIFSDFSYSQLIKVDLQSVDSLLVRDTINIVKDINGEICSLVLFETGLEGLKFYSNLGVEKIIKIAAVYKVWIPNEAKIIKFIIPDFPLYQYNLPESSHKYTKYIINIQADKNEKTIIKDTTHASLSITTTPNKARIYLNGYYAGKSPIIIKEPKFYKFDYNIRRKYFASYSATDSMDMNIKSLTVELENLVKSKRYFALINMIGDGLSVSQVDSHGMFGITFGLFGETGFYGSLSFLSVDEKVATPQYNSSDGYYDYTKGQKIRIATGVTYQILNPVFLYGGPCYTRRTYQRAGYLDGKSQSLNLDLGVVFRIGWYFLLQIDYCPKINNTYGSGGIGLGYNFAKKRKA
jgi:hypothetical protein